MELVSCGKRLLKHLLKQTALRVHSWTAEVEA